jgi:hypothetical protein
MKRYIEIVYDNSVSMTSHIHGKKKYEIAQELFEKEILPAIGLRGDHVVLRLLREGCQDAISSAEILPNQRNLMLNRIKAINHDQSTPLFYTVLDSVEACRNVIADEYKIFVLTDGDDTCGVKIEDLIDEDTIKRFVKYIDVNLLLAQLAVDSPISQNNLTAFASALGGQSVSLDSTDSISQMRKKIKLALNISGFSNKLPLDHCFDSLPGFDMTWLDVEVKGIDFHQAMLLYQKELLSWKPDFNISVSSLEFAELHFLFSLYFKSGIPEDLLITMLSQLKKPYYYSFDCIYWDFAKARWRYFVQQNQIKQLPNQEALLEDFQNSIRDVEIDFDEADNRCIYRNNQTYKVSLAPMDIIAFKLTPVHTMSEAPPRQKVRILEEGDEVVFKRK